MRLEMGHIYIKDIQFATESKIEDGVLYVSEEALKAVALEDEKLKSVSFDIAKPGESVRITPVKDVIEPRVKVEGRGGIFPGVIPKVDTVVKNIGASTGADDLSMFDDKTKESIEHLRRYIGEDIDD